MSGVGRGGRWGGDGVVGFVQGSCSQDVTVKEAKGT
jgi:hypothetical protein